MRINIINPLYLADQHLIAEYREIKMSTDFYRRSADSPFGVVQSRISKNYKLGIGHAYMWYDKMQFVKSRFELIKHEMKSRNFKCASIKIDFSGIPKKAFGDFVPNEKDLKINIKRILNRIALKPLWYRYYGEVKSMKFWKDLYKNI